MPLFLILEDIPPSEHNSEMSKSDSEEEDDEEDTVAANIKTTRTRKRKVRDDLDESEDGVSTSRKRMSRQGSAMNAGSPDGIDDDDQTFHRKRGRPPKVDTPDEARVKTVLRAARKLREGGRILFTHFDRLPDGAQYPDYYQIITNPIAVDTIKKKVKRRQYRNVDDLIQDLTLMFNNARIYNDENSQIYQDATRLLQFSQEQADLARQIEDKDLVDANADDSAAGGMRIPVDSIERDGLTYQIGDWVHIKNPNDGERSIVGQIFRTFRTPEYVGQNQDTQ